MVSVAYESETVISGEHMHYVGDYGSAFNFEHRLWKGVSCVKKPLSDSGHWDQNVQFFPCPSVLNSL